MEVGIFVPVIKGTRVLNWTRISKCLGKKIAHKIAPVRQIFLDEKGHYDQRCGLVVLLKHEHQLAMVEAMPIIKSALSDPELFDETEYSVPLNNVPAPGFGEVTKSMSLKIAMDTTPDNIQKKVEEFGHMLEEIHRSNGISAYLNMVVHQNGIEILSTSPVVIHNNHFAWQQFLARALRKAGYQPAFFTSWSTNKELEKFYREKMEERKQKFG